MRRDEYGDIPGQGDNHWATPDTILPDADLHTEGSLRVGGNIVFWMTPKKPPGMSHEEFEAKQQARWDRAFPKGVK